MVESDKPQTTIWRMRIACCKLRLQTRTQNMSYSKLFHGKILRERASILRLYVPCLSCFVKYSLCYVNDFDGKLAASFISDVPSTLRDATLSFSRSSSKTVRLYVPVALCNSAKNL